MPGSDLDRGKTNPNSRDKLRLAQLRRGNEVEDDGYDEDEEHEVDEEDEHEVVVVVVVYQAESNLGSWVPFSFN